MIHVTEVRRCSDTIYEIRVNQWYLGDVRQRGKYWHCRVSGQRRWRHGFVPNFSMRQAVEHLMRRTLSKDNMSEIIIDLTWRDREQRSIIEVSKEE